MRSILLLLLSFTFPFLVHAQSNAYSRKIVKTLTGPEFWGRGYTKNGMGKAANYLARQYANIGLQRLSKNYLQPFRIPVNTFPFPITVVLDGQVLQPGKDFIVGPESQSLAGSFPLRKKDSTTFVNNAVHLTVQKTKKMIWSPSSKIKNQTRLILLDTLGTLEPKIIQLQLPARFDAAFEAQNVVGMVRGTEHPDSFFVITAHYDHLGGMGDRTYFPGANDNASGTALLLNLARYYAQHPLKTSVVFIAFAAEEIGLKGSKHFVDHPLVDLRRIKFLVNLDMTGTGTEGISVVNGTELPDQFALLNEISLRKKLFTDVRAGGKAANSDHHYFYEKGVPSFFLFTRGGTQHYHNIYDQAWQLPVDHHQKLFTLLTNFFKAIDTR